MNCSNRIATIVIGATFPLVAMGVETADGLNLPTTISAVTTYISHTLVEWLSAIFWACTAIFILWAAFLYLLGASEEERITRAKQILIYAVIAGIVAIFATIGLGPIINSLFLP